MVEPITPFALWAAGKVSVWAWDSFGKDFTLELAETMTGSMKERWET